MTPIRREHMSMEQEGKEPYGPACRDYFWIICRLVDNLEDNESNDLVDLDHLARQLACGIVSRKLYEKRHGDSTPDDTLVGALQLLGVVMKQVNTVILIAIQNRVFDVAFEFPSNMGSFRIFCTPLNGAPQP